MIIIIIIWFPDLLFVDVDLSSSSSSFLLSISNDWFWLWRQKPSWHWNLLKTKGNVVCIIDWSSLSPVWQSWSLVQFCRPSPMALVLLLLLLLTPLWWKKKFHIISNQILIVNQSGDQLLTLFFHANYIANHHYIWIIVIEWKQKKISSPKTEQKMICQSGRTFFWAFDSSPLLPEFFFWLHQLNDQTEKNWPFVNFLNSLWSHDTNTHTLDCRVFHCGKKRQKRDWNWILCKSMCKMIHFWQIKCWP